jgi:hypothetical protein
MYEKGVMSYPKLVFFPVMNSPELLRNLRARHDDEHQYDTNEKGRSSTDRISCKYEM